jgi:hypothetical protein
MKKWPFWAEGIQAGALLGTTPASCAKHDSAARPRLLDLSHIVSAQPTRHIIECEQMRARLEATTKENDTLRALIDMQFLRIYNYPRATLSTGTLTERQAQQAAFP